MASLYDAIAEHLAEGRAPDVDPDQMTSWLALIDNGSDPTWDKIDDALDELVHRFKEGAAGAVDR